MEARRISAVLCSGDLERSRTFYEQVVALTLSPETIPNHLLFECGDGTTLLVYGRPAPNKADHTQVRFWTDDVESDVRSSRAGAPSSRTMTSRRSRRWLTSPRPSASASRPGSRTPTETRSPSSSPSSHFGAAHSVGQPRCALRVRECLPALCSIGLIFVRSRPNPRLLPARGARRVPHPRPAIAHSHAPGSRMSHERSSCATHRFPECRGGVCHASEWRRSRPAPWRQAPLSCRGQQFTDRADHVVGLDGRRSRQARASAIEPDSADSDSLRPCDVPIELVSDHPALDCRHTEARER